MQLEKVNKLLIVRLSSLGDILLSTPLIRSIKIRFPKTKIDFVVREEYKDLLLLNPHLRNILIYNNDDEKLKFPKDVGGAKKQAGSYFGRARQQLLWGQD